MDYLLNGVIHANQIEKEEACTLLSQIDFTYWVVNVEKVLLQGVLMCIENY